MRWTTTFTKRRVVDEFEEIRKRIAGLYAVAEPECQVDAPWSLRARQLSGFAREYMNAAETLEKHRPQAYLARLQLAGQAIELAFKACLASKGLAPPKHHDLLQLHAKATELDCELTVVQYAAVVHVHHVYFEDLVTGTRYKARYPTERLEHLGSAVPDGEMFSTIVESLLGQALHETPGDGTSSSKKRS